MSLLNLTSLNSVALQQEAPSFYDSEMLQSSSPQFYSENVSDSETLSLADKIYNISLAMVLFVISIVTLLGNVITILAVKTVHNLRSKTNYLIVSLACADLMVSFFFKKGFGLSKEKSSQSRRGAHSCKKQFLKSEWA